MICWHPLQLEVTNAAVSKPTLVLSSGMIVRVREDDGRKLDHKTLETMRLRAVAAVQSGQHPKDVAASLGMHRTTVYG